MMIDNCSPLCDSCISKVKNIHVIIKMQIVMCYVKLLYSDIQQSSTNDILLHVKTITLQLSLLTALKAKVS